MIWQSLVLSRDINRILPADLLLLQTLVYVEKNSFGRFIFVLKM
jgi:hypothetical protein